MKKKKEKMIRKSLIDIIEKDLLEAGYNVERGDWGKLGKDNKDQWLDIQSDIDVKNKTRLTIHMHFDDNNKLSDIEVWKSEIILEENKQKQLFHVKK